MDRLHSTYIIGMLLNINFLQLAILRVSQKIQSVFFDALSNDPDFNFSSWILNRYFNPSFLVWDKQILCGVVFLGQPLYNSLFNNKILEQIGSATTMINMFVEYFK